MLIRYSALSVRGYWCWVIKKHAFNSRYAAFYYVF
jgi:hypothetical protein